MNILRKNESMTINEAIAVLDLIIKDTKCLNCSQCEMCQDYYSKYNEDLCVQAVKLLKSFIVTERKTHESRF